MEITVEKQKEFALAQIAPYFKNPEICGFNKEKSTCNYITDDGRMCVAGKNMIKPEKFGVIAINEILSGFPQELVFRPEVVDILNTEQWKYLQIIHDRIAAGKDIPEIAIEKLDLFTLEELQEYANNLN